MLFVCGKLLEHVRVEEGQRGMGRSTKAIKKWHRRAIFIDLHKTKVTIFQNSGEASENRNAPEGFPMKTMESLSKVKDCRKSSFQGSLPTMELLLAISSIVCFIVYVYFAGLSYQIDSIAIKSQLEVTATLSFIVGINVSVSLITSVIVKRLFSNEM